MTLVVVLAGVAGAAAGAVLADLARSVATAVARRSRPTARGGGRGAGRWLAPIVALGRRVGAPQAPSRLAARLAAAGVDRRVRSTELMATKSGLSTLAGALGAAVVLGAGMRVFATVTALCAAAGFLAPDLVLARRARVRLLRAALELPGLLDLLRVTVDAGLPVGRALAEVADRSTGVIAAELRDGERRVALGEQRATVLATLEERLPLPEIAVTVAAVRRSLHHGTPLGPALAALAVEARGARVRKLHEHASRAVPRIQLAIALLLVPAVMLVVAAMLVPVGR